MLLTVTGGMNSFLQFVTVLIIFIFVLAIAWAATKLIANVQNGKSFGMNIEVVETYRLTANKYIQIVRTGDKYIAIAICKDTVTMLAEIPAEQIHLSEKPENGVPDFKKLLDRAMKKDKTKETENRRDR